MMIFFGGCITSGRFWSWSRSRGRHKNFTIDVSECLNASGFDASWHPYESGAARNDIWLKFPLRNTNCPTLLIIDTPESSLAKESVMWNSSKRHLFVYTDSVFSCGIFQLFSHLLLKISSSISSRISWYHTNITLSNSNTGRHLANGIKITTIFHLALQYNYNTYFLLRD